MLLFTVQRLTGYMSLWLYKRLPYDDLVLLAHFFGGAGLVAVCTLGTKAMPMRLRAVPVLRAMVSAGWLVGSVVVLLLWWICSPALWPDDGATQAVAMIAALALNAFLFRPVENWVSTQPTARKHGRSITPAGCTAGSMRGTRGFIRVRPPRPNMIPPPITCTP